MAVHEDDFVCEVCGRDALTDPVFLVHRDDT
jgi:hypothetical protein